MFVNSCAAGGRQLEHDVPGAFRRCGSIPVSNATRPVRNRAEGVSQQVDLGVQFYFAGVVVSVDSSSSCKVAANAQNDLARIKLANRPLCSPLWGRERQNCLSTGHCGQVEPLGDHRQSRENQKRQSRSVSVLSAQRSVQTRQLSNACLTRTALFIGAEKPPLCVALPPPLPRRRRTLDGSRASPRGSSE